MLFLSESGLVSVTEAISDAGMMRHHFSFHRRALSHAKTGSVLNRGLNEYLIIRHFWDTCVNGRFLIKKRWTDMSSLLTRLKRYIVKCFCCVRIDCWAWQQQEACYVKQLKGCIYFLNVPHIGVYNPLPTLLPLTSSRWANYSHLYVILTVSWNT